MQLSGNAIRIPIEGQKYRNIKTKKKLKVIRVFMVTRYVFLEKGYGCRLDDFFQNYRRLDDK